MKNLFPNNQNLSPAKDFKSLNYLGSKMRILDFLEENILRVTPERYGICDLFAGSGCVANRLANKRRVCAADIQEYSRVICSALLCPPIVSSDFVGSFLESVKIGLYEKLSLIYSPLIKIENDAINNKDMATLSSIIDNGSLEVFLKYHKCDDVITSALHEVSANIINTTLPNVDMLISKYYGGVYFSYEQAIQIDAILKRIQDLPLSCKDLFLAALISTVSEIVNTVGKHFAQPLKPHDNKGVLKNFTKKIEKDRTMDVFEIYSLWLQKYISVPSRNDKNIVYKSDYFTCLNNLPNEIRTVYADPPYTRDHYSRYYHLLETIALRDTPSISTTNIGGVEQYSRGIYREDRFQSPFCIKKEAPIEFERMFKFCSDTERTLILSYSPYDETKKTHPRVVTMTFLEELANKYFRNVQVISAGRFNHSKLNSIEHHLDASDMAESIFVCY